MIDISVKISASLGGASRFGAATLLIIALAACSDDPQPRDDNFIPGTNSTRNQDHESDVDDDADEEVSGDDIQDDAAGDADPDAEDDDTDDGEDDTGPDPQDNICGDLIELGLLEGSYQESFTVNFADYDDRFRTTCDESAQGRNEVIFHFELAGEGRLSVDASTELIFETRSHHCADFHALECFAGSVDGYIGWPPQYLLIEKLNDADPDEVEITISYEEFDECLEEELGQSECLDGQQIRACNTSFGSPDTPHWLEFNCPAGCEDDRCRGDSCDAPILVTDQIALTAHHHVLSDQHNSLGVDACGPEGGVGEDLEGRELVFQFPDLSLDQEVVVQAVHDGLYVGQEINLLFKDGCDDQLACLDFHQGEDVYSFSPPDDGTYFLFVDLPQGFDGKTIVEIQILDK